MGIDFYSNPVSAPARMVLLFAKHLGVEMDVKNLDMLKGEHLKPEFVTINIQHTVPTMVDNGFVLTESRAILSYLQGKYGKDDSLYPKEVEKRALVDMRMYFDVSMLYPRFEDTYYPIMIGGQSALEQAKVDKLNDALGFLEHYLKDGGYVAGSKLTIADFSMTAVLSTIEAVHGLDKTKLPKTVAYLEKCKGQMKGYQELNHVGALEFSQWYKDALAKNKA